MSGNDSIIILNSLSVSSNILIPYVVKFWLYLIFFLPSILCTLFMLYHLLFDRTLRRALNNHVIIIILLTVLICEVTMYPWMFYYYSHGGIWQRSYIFCSIWSFIDYSLYVMQIGLFAWASIERHILIFHDGWVATEKKRFFIHYLPLILIVSYYLIFYFILYFLPSCQNIFNTNPMICITICSFDSNTFHGFEITMNNLIPNLIIIIFSIALLIRVFQQKQRVRQPIRWRKHRKMTIQLLSISFLYLIVTFPFALMSVLRICGLPNNVGVIPERLSIFLSYFIALLFPFVAIFSVPEILTKVKTIFQLRRPTRSVGPEVVSMRHMQRNITVPAITN